MGRSTRNIFLRDTCYGEIVSAWYNTLNFMGGHGHEVSSMGGSTKKSSPGTPLQYCTLSI